MTIDLPYRQIHLDFHTSIGIDDVGHEFDADVFGDTMAQANVNNVTLFGKCHHGLLYYGTDHEARHPGLRKGHDLLGEQIEALHKRGIRAPIYMSAQCDEYVAQHYPQWLTVHKEESQHPLEARWHLVDMASPYQDYFADQIVDMIKRFKPVDGLFIDMCWDQVSYSPYAIDKMRTWNLDPSDEKDASKFARRLVHEYMSRYIKLARDLHGGQRVPIWFNSRPAVRQLEEKRFLTHIEIEALPTGGWGYAYFPMHVRLLRPVGVPYLGMTSRFHKSWGDFGGLKPKAALRYECCQALAHGARCSIGDQLHPRGTLSTTAYQTIGEIFRYVEACEPFCHGAKQDTEIAVIRANADGYHCTSGAEAGALRALQQLRHQFDFRLAGVNVDLRGYKAAIVLSDVTVDDKMVKQFKAFVRGGGSLLICGDAAVDADGKPVMSELGVRVDGLSPYETTYIRFDRALARDMAGEDHVMYERGWRMYPGKGAAPLARVVEPYFDRSWEHFCSHSQTPPAKLSPYSAAIEHQHTRGGAVITVAMPIFRAYAKHGNLPYRRLIGACLDRLLPDPVLRLDGPSHVETTVTRKGGKTIVHVLSYVAARRCDNLDIVEEATPVIGATLSLRTDRAPKRITLQPHDNTVDFDYDGERANVTFDLLDGHGMIVFE